MSLGNNLKARGSVEKWLGDVEARMIQSLKKLAKSSYCSYLKEQRSDWVLQQTAQLVLAISQVHWCEEMEQALETQKTNSNSIEEFYEVSVISMKSVRLFVAQCTTSF